MGSPGIIHTNNLGGQYGLSGQSNQQNAGNSLNPYVGYGNSTPGGLIYGTYQQLQNSTHGYLVQAIANQGAIEKPEPLKVTSIKLGEIIGVRGWRVNGRFLHSMSAGVIWAPGEVMEGKTKTEEYGDHGIYAYKLARDFLWHVSDALHVYGKVAMWGDIIEHELGYRAQFAKIISLDHWCQRTGSATHGISLDQLRKMYCPEAA